MVQDQRGGLGGLSAIKQADLDLIRLLSDGQFRSGSELGERLGISRAAVWKRVQRLEAVGLALESVKGKGYRLAQPLELINPDVLSATLAGKADLHYLWVTESTNSDALAAAGGDHPQLFVAEYQSAGRGRRGRQWQSPFAANLYLSLRFTLQGGFSALSGLSLAVGVAVAEALQSLDPRLAVGLKWPNDVLVNGAKLGGVLVEVAGEADGQVDVVVGVGLNGAMTPAQAAGIDQRWTDLASEMPERPDRTELAITVAEHLLRMLSQFAEQGFAPFVARFNRYDAMVGRLVRVLSADKALNGVARGVAADGALMLETEQGLRELYGGELTLRLQ